MANDRDPSGNLGVWLGERLRAAREAAGYTSQDALARDLGFERTTINKAETGASPASEALAAKIAARFPDLCNGLYVELCEVARRAAGNGPIPGWFADWIEIEIKASILRWWEPLLIPGLLQTEDYARALLSTWRRDTPDEIEAKLKVRLRRQDTLARADIRMLIDEPVLHRQIGSPEIMAAQIEHIKGVASLPNVSVQVIPLAAGAYAGLSGAFAVAEIPGEPDAAYLETGVQGIMWRDPTLVTRTARMFDDLRDEALSRSKSLELIAEVEKP